MTTTSDKLLARADEYERKAQMLRFAAAELDGDAVNGKRKTFVSTLDQAIALRKAHQNGHQPAPSHQGVAQTRATIPERQATVRAFLEAAKGPQTTRAIGDQLEAQGQGCSSSWVLKVLSGMRDVHKQGRGARSAWGLGKAQRIASKPTTRAEQRAKRERIAEVLNAYDRETPREPGEVAKSFGLTVAQSGLAPLVHQGYLKKRKGGYVRTAKAYVIVAPISAQP